MVNAQRWLDKNYPTEKRINIKRLNISNKDLEGELKLDGFNNLEKLDCSNNLITRLDLTSCGKLIKLIVSDNDFDEQDLTCFSHLTNLEKLYLGTSSENSSKKKIQEGIWNRFNGSLEPLKNLVELRELGISSTNIDRGLEHLPDSLEKLYCFNYLDEKAGCKKIRKELKNCLSENNQYYDLRKWRRVQRVNTVVSFPLPYFSSTTNNEIKAAQKWLNKNYPKKDRGTRIDLNISSSELGKIILEGPLNLTDFKDLKSLNCSGHKQITKLELVDYPRLEKLCCNQNQLEDLNISNCPKLDKIDCSGNRLTSLNISNCPQLTVLRCSNNRLTHFNFKALKKEKLILLDLNSNRLSPLDLSELDSFVNLESIDIGSNDQEKINGGFYNHFFGSLKPLKNMSKLKLLNIEATDIVGGLEYLPDENLAFFYCSSHNTLTEVRGIEKTLKKYSDSFQTPQFVSSQSQHSSSLALSVVEEEKAFCPNSSFDSNYFENLQRWRKQNHDLIQKAKRDDGDEFTFSYRNNQQVKQVELEKLNRKTKNKVDSGLESADYGEEIVRKGRELKRKEKIFDLYIEKGNEEGIEKLEKEITKIEKEISKLKLEQEKQQVAHQVHFLPK